MKNGILWIFKLTVTILILTYIFSRIPVSSILNAFSNLEISLILYLLPIIVLSTIISALQLKVFTDNHRMSVSFSRILSINFSTEFYNLFLPSYLAGGAIRWHKLSKDNRKRTEAFAALILNRLVNTLTLAIFGFICWKFDTTIIVNDYYGWFFLTLFAGLLGVYALLFSRRMTTTFKNIQCLSYFQMIPAAMLRGLSKLHEAAVEYQQLSLREHGVIIFLSCFWQILGGMFFFLVARSIGIDIGFESLGWIRSILGLLLLFPVSISGFGVREGGLIFLFAYFGVAPATAVAFSFLLFARTLLLGIIGALLEVKEALIPAEQKVLKR